VYVVDGVIGGTAGICKKGRSNHTTWTSHLSITLVSAAAHLFRNLQPSACILWLLPQRSGLFLVFGPLTVEHLSDGCTYLAPAQLLLPPPCLIYHVPQLFVLPSGAVECAPRAAAAAGAVRGLPQGSTRCTQQVQVPAGRWYLWQCMLHGMPAT